MSNDSSRNIDPTTTAATPRERKRQRPVGISSRYVGKDGEDYSANHQGIGLHDGFVLDASFFLPYIKSTDRVLDFGCGNGGIALQIMKTGCHLDALEVNPAAAKVAVRNGLDTVFPDINSLPGEGVYDVIYTNHVLEHVRDVCGTLEELRHCLKPGGRLIAKLPIDDVHAKHQQAWSKRDTDHHLQTWTPRLFANVLTESGYRVKESRVLCHAWHPKLFGIARIGIGSLKVGRVLWPAFAWWKNRRQVFAVGTRPRKKKLRRRS